jgi:hypothetical protein
MECTRLVLEINCLVAGEEAKWSMLLRFIIFDYCSNFSCQKAGVNIFASVFTISAQVVNGKAATDEFVIRYFGICRTPCEKQAL